MENENGDVCVFDINVSIVVVLDMIGWVWFWFDGLVVKIKGFFNLNCLVIYFLG